MARTTGSQNVVTLYGTFGGPITLAGAGAGGDPTAVAVLSDLYAIERSRRRAVLADVSCIGAE
jgi:homoserine dehydrogenase